WRPQMTREDAIKIASEAIQAGIFNDLGSGSNVDVCVITADKTTLMRNHIRPNQREQKQRSYLFKRGTTAVLKEKVITREEISKYVTVQELPSDDDVVVVEKMDIDA
ncbi:MAG: hypothetical protein Q9193_007331, partial [Seirophora villosa]